MAKKRLTAVKFRKLLEVYPRFQLDMGTWLCPSSRGKPCGGCAMTLAYKEAHPNANLNKIKYHMVEEWAYDIYGRVYTNDFINTFDGDTYVPTKDYRDPVAAKDGFECRKAAIKLGRLQVEE